MARGRVELLRNLPSGRTGSGLRMVKPALLTHNRSLDARLIFGPDAFRITRDNRENGRLDCQTARSYVLAIQQWRNLEPRPPLDCRVEPTGISKIRCSPRKPVPSRKCTAAWKACVRVARKLVERPPACLLDRHKQPPASCRGRAPV